MLKPSHSFHTEAVVRIFALLFCLFALGTLGCAATGGGETASSSGQREPSRCGACNGSGQTKDYNRGTMETCHYCNGRGAW
jgi:hypothetical protein